MVRGKDTGNSPLYIPKYTERFLLFLIYLNLQSVCAPFLIHKAQLYIPAFLSFVNVSSY